MFIAADGTEWRNQFTRAAYVAQAQLEATPLSDIAKRKALRAAIRHNQNEDHFCRNGGRD